MSNLYKKIKNRQFESSKDYKVLRLSNLLSGTENIEMLVPNEDITGKLNLSSYDTDEKIEKLKKESLKYIRSFFRKSNRKYNNISTEEELCTACRKAVILFHLKSELVRLKE